MGVIFLSYRQHLIHIWLICGCNTPDVSVIYVLGTVFQGSEGVRQSQFVYSPKFSKIRSGVGGGLQNLHFLPK